MTTNFTLEFHGNYIRVQHPEDYEITPKGQYQLWTAIAEACKKYNCRRVLAESPAPPKRSMSTMDAFRSAEKAMQSAPGLSMACCFPGYKPDETTELFKTAAFNRGVRIEFFSKREEALNWLRVDQAEQAS